MITEHDTLLYFRRTSGSLAFWATLGLEGSSRLPPVKALDVIAHWVQPAARRHLLPHALALSATQEDGILLQLLFYRISSHKMGCWSHELNHRGAVVASYW